MGSLNYVLQNDVSFAPGYSMSKAAVNIAVGKFAVKLKDEGVIFLSVSPGFVKTSLARKSPSRYLHIVKVVLISFSERESRGVLRGGNKADPHQDT